MNDILSPSYYDQYDAEDLRSKLQSAGLHNVGELVHTLLNRVAELETRLEDCQSQIEDLECINDSLERDSYLFQQQNSGIQEFINQYNWEFKRNLVRIRNIGGVGIAVVRESDLDTLESQFHSLCDADD